jgi:tRNA threonylcarbamoyladenosine biosynthesis protein TsaE
VGNTQPGTDAFTVRSASPGQTGQIAAVVARYLKPGDVVLLMGGLAAGKTTFVQAVTRALDSADAVTSPTFALVHFYTGRTGRVMHIDTYRLSSVHEFRDLGIDEYLDESITLIEWGGLVEADFPAHLRVEITQAASQDDRVLAFGSAGLDWPGRLQALRDELGRELSVAAS